MCEKLEEDFGFVHLSAGELLRKELKRGTELAEIIDDHITNGKIVDGSITCQLLKNEIEEVGVKKTYLVDGFPRNKNNVESWYDVLGGQTDLKRVVYITVDEETMMKRILNRGKTSGRTDDNEETARKRFQTFYNESKPVIEDFRAWGDLSEVDGSGTVDNCYAETLKVLGLDKDRRE